MEIKSQNYFSHERHCAERSPTTTSAFPSASFTPLATAPTTSSSVRLPLDCSAPPHRGHKGGGHRLSRRPNKHCMCSPSTNPGAFRCMMHRSSGDQPPSLASDKPSQSLKFRRSVMINQMMKSGGDEEEGDAMRRVMYANLIRRHLSSNRPQQRRLDFEHRPTRFHVAFMEGQARDGGSE